MKVTFKNETPKFICFDMVAVGKFFTLAEAKQNEVFMKMNNFTSGNSFHLETETMFTTYEGQNCFLREVEIMVIK